MCGSVYTLGYPYEGNIICVFKGLVQVQRVEHKEIVGIVKGGWFPCVPLWKIQVLLKSKVTLSLQKQDHAGFCLSYLLPF